MWYPGFLIKTAIPMLIHGLRESNTHTSGIIVPAKFETCASKSKIYFIMASIIYP